jgi:hypothetical protein
MKLTKLVWYFSDFSMIFSEFCKISVFIIKRKMKEKENGLNEFGLAHKRSRLWQNHLTYGPHVLIIVFQTSTSSTWVPYNSIVCRVSSGSQNHPRFVFWAGSITVTLQNYNSYINIQIYYIRVQRKSYNNIIFQISIKFLQTIIITNHSFAIQAVG